MVTVGLFFMETTVPDSVQGSNASGKAISGKQLSYTSNTGTRCHLRFVVVKDQARTSNEA